ncbi:hypothetical protein DFJ67_1937 [Asanoa ferruginea]|uniref:DUF4386 family protein n=1 Tax=Asanoa ferruginea TaxID=53367 RepID=A0A3D9ZHP0_9ACTN|nr:hypothetical protein [Asanoa ferruginea]REF95972.1 hypothetical protein DFJ67_1937 [Asanoa ferruginea]GIF48167.1 hypothetical protein Afe04nite_27060 [Asanoa ferruginea]
MTIIESRPQAASDATNGLWRVGGGLALIAWPVFHLAGFLTSPPGETHAPHLYREHATLVQVSAVILHYSAILIVPVVLALAHFLKQRMPRLAAITGLIGAFAAISGSALLLTDFYDLALAKSVPDPQAVAITDLANGYPGVLYGFLLPAFLVHPALLVLAGALVRTGVLRWWQFVLLLAGLAVPFLTTAQAPVVQSVGPVLILAALAPLGLRMLKRA